MLKKISIVTLILFGATNILPKNLFTFLPPEWAETIKNIRLELKKVKNPTTLAKQLEKDLQKIENKGYGTIFDAIQSGRKFFEKISVKEKAELISEINGYYSCKDTSCKNISCKDLTRFTGHLIFG